MGREVALGQDQDARSAVWFELVKSLAHYVEPTPFSDSLHNLFEMDPSRHPHTRDVPDEMALHLSFYGLFILYTTRITAPTRYNMPKYIWPGLAYC